ncbi:MAG: heme exporter protein CcmB [Acidimicrobiales bacterium]
MWRDAALVAGKDLRIELRSRVALAEVLPFGLVLLVLFGLALGPDHHVLSGVAAGLFWVAVVLATILAVQRAFAIESADDARDGLRLSGLDPAGVFCGKAIAIGAQLVALEVVLAVAGAFLFGVHLTGALELVGACAGATVGLVSVGTVYGVVSVSARVRETILPLLFLPVVAPVLLAAVKTSNAALSGSPSGGYVWLELLGVFAVVYSVVGAVAFGPLLEGA